MLAESPLVTALTPGQPLAPFVHSPHVSSRPFLHFGAAPPIRFPVCVCVPALSAVRGRVPRGFVQPTPLPHPTRAPTEPPSAPLPPALSSTFPAAIRGPLILNMHKINWSSQTRDCQPCLRVQAPRGLQKGADDQTPTRTRSVEIFEGVLKARRGIPTCSRGESC